MKQRIRYFCLTLLVMVAGMASAQDVVENPVAQIGSKGYATLQEAIAEAQSGATIELLENVDATGYYKENARMPISKSMTINGNGRTVTVASKGFGVGMNASEKIDVTFKDITIQNPSSGGRCIDTRGNIGTLTIDNSKLSTGGGNYDQPLTIGGNQSDAATVTITNSSIQTNDAGTAYYAIITFNPVNMTISNSTIKGWACIYAKGPNGSTGSAGSVFTIDNSTIVSSNVYSGNSNSFSAFMIEDNNVAVNVTNSNVTIQNTGDQIQSIGGTQKDSGLSGVVVNLGEGNNVTFVGPRQCKLTTNQASVNVNGGTFNVQLPDEILPEGYICVPNGDGTFTVKQGAWVAQIGDVKYESLEAAFAAVKDGESVVMLSDVTLSDKMVLSLEGKTVSLDLGGKTLNGRTNLTSGKLTVKNGIVNCEGGQPLNVYGSATAGAENYSVLTIAEDVTVSGAYGVCMFGPTASSKAGYGAVINVAGTLNGTSGTVFVSGNLGQNITEDMHNVINITGTVNGNDDAGVAINGLATVNVKSGANITGNTGIAIKRGTLNVEDGATVHGTGAENLTPDPNNNGTEMTGAAVSMTDTYNQYGAMSVNITGGTFTSENTVALFKEEGTYASDATYAVSGGTFSSSVLAEFCAPGYEPKDLGNGQYSVYAPAYSVTVNKVDPKTDWYMGMTTSAIQFSITKDGSVLSTKDQYTEQLDKWDIILDENYLRLKSKVAAAKWIRCNLTPVGTGTTTVVFQNKANPSIKVEQEVTITHKLILVVQPSGTHMVEAGPVEIGGNTKFDGVKIEDYSQFTFTSSDETIATISGTTITPLKSGTITVTVTKNDDPSATASANITFIDAPAKIGETYYESISKALKAAKSGETITLLRDVTESTSFSGEQPRVSDFALTIDLNGHTWTGASQPYTLKMEYGVITIKDSQGGGGVKYGNDYAFIVSHLAAEYPSKLILESGTFTGKTSVAQVGYPGGTGGNKKYYGGDLVINGGTFVTVPDVGETYDENGNFKYTLNMLDMVESSYPGGIYSPSTITVNGGKFLKFDPQNNLAEGANTNFVPEGYVSIKSVEGDNTWYTIGKAVAQIGDAKYESLEAAFAAVKDGETVAMLSDVTLSDKMVLSLEGKTVSLDLGGKTLNGRTNLTSGKLTVKNGIVNCEGGQPLNVYGSATAGAENYSVLTIAEDVTVSGAYGVCMFGPTASSKAGYGAVINVAGTLNGTSGTVFVSGNLGQNITEDMHNVINITGTVNGNDDAGVAINGLATVNVKSGANITGNTGIAIKRGTLNVEDGATVHGTGAENLTPDPNNNGTEMTGAAVSMTDTYNQYGAMSVNITGGTFTSENTVALFKEEGTYASDATYAVSGGTFSSSVLAEFCAPGYEPKDLGNGQYSVYAPAYSVTVNKVDPKTDWYMGMTTSAIQFSITKDGSVLSTKDQYTEQLDKWDIILDENYLRLKSKVAAAKWIRCNLTPVGTGTTTVVFQNKANPSIKVEQEVTITHKLILVVQPSGTHMVEAGPVEIGGNTKFDGVKIEDYSQFTFTSSDETIATISGTTITPLKSGTITVTVTKNDDPSATASANITFIDAPAKIGETYYESISKALKAAKSGETITLLRDVTESTSFSGEQPRVSDFALTIDLNGHTWTGASQPYTLKMEYGVITIKDSQGGGGVKYGNDYAFIVSHLAAEYPSKLILESGTFTGKTSVAQVGYPGGTGGNKKYYGGDLVINGGTFVTVPDVGETYDENGNFKYTLNMLDMVESSYPGGIYSPSTITVNGGKFLKFDPQNNLAEGANTNFVPEGYVSIKSVEGDNTWYTIGKAVAQIGDVKYETLEAAWAEVKDGETITLLADCTGNGIKAPQGKFATGVTIDFNKHTYTMDGSTVGSSGTKTQAFQLLKDNKITFKNGSIIANNSDVKMMIQNYSDLTLDHMVLDATQGTNNIGYVLSTNFGNTTIKDTKIVAKENGTAFDACTGWGGYTSNNVELTGSSEITGPIEVSFSGDGTAPVLKLTSGTHNGEIVMAQGADKATVTKKNDFVQAAPADYKWKDNGDGTSTLIKDDGIFELVHGEPYPYPEGRKASKVTYRRSFETEEVKHYRCWYVPFDYTIQAEDMNNFDFYKIHMIAGSGDTGGEVADNTKVYIYIEKVKDAGTVLRGNRPYVIRPKSAMTDHIFTADNITEIYPENNESRLHQETTEFEYDYYGTYREHQATGRHEFISLNKKGQTQWNASENAKLQSYVWYIKVTSRGDIDYAKTNIFFVDIDDDTTDIFRHQVDSNDVEGVYTVSGAKVEKPVKGVNIIRYKNGTTKKIYVK